MFGFEVTLNDAGTQGTIKLLINEQHEGSNTNEREEI